MVSDNVKRGLKIIARYPEIFQMLEEYDNTHKLRKVYSRKRLNITIDENVLRDFKAHAAKENMNISRFVEGKMVEEMKS